MTKKISEILTYFDKLVPDAHCELEYTTDYSFLIAVMLSAQTTDKKVNAVTKVLFSKYDTLEKLGNADEKDIEKIIHPLGFSKTKSKNVKLIAQKLLSNFDGKVPSKFEDLLTLPGVGMKTSKVVRCELFKIPNVPVDTHIERITKRLGIAKQSETPDEISEKLEKLIDKDRQIKAHHQFIFFGRYHCTSKNPKCENCEISHFCHEKTKKSR